MPLILTNGLVTGTWGLLYFLGPKPFPILKKVCSLQLGPLLLLLRLKLLPIVTKVLLIVTYGHF
jgi:hypothetical protein